MDLTPAPYQKVLDADFSALRTPGVYRVLVNGLGVSLPFRIDMGTAAAFRPDLRAGTLSSAVRHRQRIAFHAIRA